MCSLSMRKSDANHLDERLLDQVHARASCIPLLGGHSRSIPQGMIIDVQPLVNNEFIILPNKTIPQWIFGFSGLYPLKLDITF